MDKIKRRLRVRKVKIKLLFIISLTSFLFLYGCGNGGNTNKINSNAVNAIAATPTQPPTPANADPALKTRIEAELKKKGFNAVTVDISTTPPTLRGNYPQGKLAEVIQTAQIANGGEPVNNGMAEEK